MKFCKGCGGALNLFETHDEELCYTCLRKEIQQPRPTPVQETGTSILLPEALLSHEDGKLVLRAAEGWILWSAADNQPHSLGSILTKARRIYEIRKKRQR